MKPQNRILRKACALFLSVLLLVSGIPMTVGADEVAMDGGFSYSVMDDKAYVVGADETVSGDITIPSTLGGYPVGGIAASAFEYNNRITGVTIPEGVTTIAGFAFASCQNLESVFLPEGLELIDIYAFESCEKLKSITLPESLDIIGSNAFEYCIALEEITIPAGVQSIRSSAFSGCTALKAINVESSNRSYKSVDGVLFSADGRDLIQALCQ